MSRTYFGSRVGGNIIVMVRDEATGKTRHLTAGPSQEVYNHSTEFEWGYGGSGPAQLSLAILLDHIGQTPLEQRIVAETAPRVAERFYQMFKQDFVVGWNDDRWELKSADIDGWLRQVVAQAETKRREYSHTPEFPKELQGGKQ